MAYEALKAREKAHEEQEKAAKEAKAGILLKIPVRSEALVSQAMSDFLKNTAEIIRGSPDGEVMRTALAASQKGGIARSIEPPEISNPKYAQNLLKALGGIAKETA